MPKKILVIDDEELIIKSLAKLLEKTGFEVFVAKNGIDALAMVEDEHFDLVIADIRMPGMNGVEIMESVYELSKNKGESPVPAIFITGYADEEIEKKAKILNPVAYIYKPFDISELVGKVKEALR